MKSFAIGQKQFNACVFQIVNIQNNGIVKKFPAGYFTNIDFYSRLENIIHLSACHDTLPTIRPTALLQLTKIIIQLFVGNNIFSLRKIYISK